MNYKYFDIENWSRKAQFNFFKDYDNPFFNICFDIDVSKAYSFAKENNESFFLISLFTSIKAANQIEEFKLRIADNSVRLYDKIHCGSTAANDDNTFRFVYFNYFENFQEFKTFGEKALRADVNLNELIAKDDDLNMIHYSVIPWIKFTSVSHARKYNNGDSIPKIVFGKYFELEGKLLMPVSVEVHHSLMDAYHVYEFNKLFQENLDNIK